MKTEINPVAILAGGLATRLKPISDEIPKSLIEVCGQPFIFHQLRWLKDQEVQRVVLCVGHLGRSIQEVVGDGADFGLEVLYSYDGPMLRGTGGAIQQALPLLGSAFFVLYGDSYLDCNLREIQNWFEGKDGFALMTIFKNENRLAPSNVDYSEGKVLQYNKSNSSPQMRYIDYGLSLLRSQSLQQLESQANFDLSQLIQILLARGQLLGYEIFERFYEIGSIEGLNELRDVLGAKSSKRANRC